MSAFSFKIGNNYHPSHKDYEYGYRHLQLIDIRPNGYYDKCKSSFIFNFIVEDNSDYWKVRGSSYWKTKSRLLLNNIKKYLHPVDKCGRLPWESFYIRDLNHRKKSNWYLDWDLFIKYANIDKSMQASILDPHVYAPKVVFDGNIFYMLKNFYDDPFISYIQNQPYSSGDHTIGAAGDATDVQDALSKSTTLTDDLNWLHLSEETAMTAIAVWNLDTDAFTLTITAQSGAEHNGEAYGNGARINCGTVDGIELDGASMANCEVSKLAMDITGQVNIGVYIDDCDNALINRMLIKGNADSAYGIRDDPTGNVCKIRNNICYDIGNGAGDGGIIFDSQFGNVDVYNNTCINCYDNFRQDAAVGGATLNVYNNLAQAGQNADYVNDGAGWGNHDKNISEDATGPDAAYDNTDVNTNSVFEDYANDDFRIDRDGDSTNLAIIDDGDDLSGTFTDDIANDAGRRSDPFDIGASQRDPAAGRTTRNTDAWFLGNFIGQSFRVT